VSQEQIPFVISRYWRNNCWRL